MGRQAAIRRRCSMDGPGLAFDPDAVYTMADEFVSHCVAGA